MCISSGRSLSWIIFFLIVWFPLCPCSLPDDSELPDVGQCLQQDFRQFKFCRKSSSVSCLLHPGLGSGDQIGSTCTYQLISVVCFFFLSLLILLFLPVTLNPNSSLVSPGVAATKMFVFSPVKLVLFCVARLPPSSCH